MSAAPESNTSLLELMDISLSFQSVVFGIRPGRARCRADIRQVGPARRIHQSEILLQGIVISIPLQDNICAAARDGQARIQRTGPTRSEVWDTPLAKSNCP